MAIQPFDNEVRGETDRMHIGPYNAWFENGSLHIYGHPVGQAAGSTVTMTAQESQRFLEWLSHNQEMLSHRARTS